MTPFKDYFWKHIQKGVFLSWIALCGISIIAYTSMIIFLKNNQLTSNLNIAAYTVRESMQAGDWSLVLGHLMKLEENGPVFHIKLTSLIEHRANLTGPFGEKPFGLGYFCKTISVSSGLELDGCMRIFSGSEIITLFLFILLALGLFFIVFKTFRLKMLFIIENISESLKNIHHLNISGHRIIPNKIEEITEIASIRKYIFLLLKEEEEASKAIAMNQLSKQVAHDIRSPLTALDIIIKDIKSIPEEQRIIIRNAANRISDIANNLLSQYKQRKNSELDEVNTDIKPELISDLLTSLISEKRARYRNDATKIIINLEENTYGKFSLVSATAFKRVLSNLIDNSIEAGANKIEINLNITGQKQNNLFLQIQDNGCGIPPKTLKEIMGGTIISSKAKGHGLGLSHAIKTVKQEWGGHLNIKSSVGKGAIVEILLPQVNAPKWFQSRLTVNPNSSIVILDDDESIHQVWERRFSEINANFNFIDYYNPNDLLTLDKGQLSTTNIFLIDYEFIGCNENGLSIIEMLNIAHRSYLVTSRHEDSNIQKCCETIGLKIIPKAFAAYIPIMLKNPDKKPVDLVLIDDDQLITNLWTSYGSEQGKTIAVYHSVQNFKADMDEYDFDTPIYIDSDLKDIKNGQEYAKELYDAGFENIYLATGYRPEAFPNMYWIKKIVGKELPF